MPRAGGPQRATGADDPHAAGQVDAPLAVPVLDEGEHRPRVGGARLDDAGADQP